MSDKVAESGAKVGLAHDGDGDRLVLCDETGRVIPGDALLGLLAKHAKTQGKLAKDTLVTTIQSNAGLDHALKQSNITTARANVGDRNVLYKMQSLGANLGGESSGHIIFSDVATTGDGLLAALKVFEVMLETGKPLSELAAAFTLFPQASTALTVPNKPPLETLPTLTEAMQSLESELSGTGRILVRYSGTESKIRLLAEAKTADQANQSLAKLEAAATKDLLP